MDIGFIGIGSMGAAMVPNLVKAGHASACGTARWPRPFEHDAVVTMLSDDTAVRSVIIDSGALASARKDCVHVMMSTISLALSKNYRNCTVARGSLTWQHRFSVSLLWPQGLS
jgi:3-hydroxyisobutyrate dehydrogenase-like beta-hydroxyacid dehydrogenase